eukprot:SAG31_NODE_1052_length_10154_cov_2.814818_5_plen_142_part_00
MDTNTLTFLKNAACPIAAPRAARGRHPAGSADCRYSGPAVRKFSRAARRASRFGESPPPPAVALRLLPALPLPFALSILAPGRAAGGTALRDVPSTAMAEAARGGGARRRGSVDAGLHGVMMNMASVRCPAGCDLGRDIFL